MLPARECAIELFHRLSSAKRFFTQLIIAGTEQFTISQRSFQKTEQSHFLGRKPPTLTNGSANNYIPTVNLPTRLVGKEPPENGARILFF